MKNITMPKNVELAEELKKQLNEETVIVNETLDSEERKENPTKFTATDMWNCQRQSRSASLKMRWNLN